MKPVQHATNDPALPDLLKLIQTSFAYMNSRISPPSSMLGLKLADISRECESGEVWSIGIPPVACVFLKETTDALYLAKLAVADNHRRTGLARSLLRLAEERAKARKLSWLELETRVELTENHEAFERLGFVKSGEGAHLGFNRPTYIVMRKRI